MVESWRDCTLGDVLTLQRGFDLPTRLRVEGPFPVVSSAGVSGSHNEAKVHAPGVAIGRYGTLGEVHYMAEDFWPLNTTLWVKDFKGNDPLYCAHLLKTLAVAETSGSSAVPGVNRNVLHGLAVRCPPLETQQRIASILGAYDDLIEVNRRRVAVLEEMARGLFEEWFVRFRFPGHEDVPIVDTPDRPLPEGWEWKNLYDAAEVSFGFAFKSKAFSTEPIGSRVVRIRDVQEGRTSTWTEEEFDPKYQVRNGDILVGMDGIFHTNFWVGGNAALNQRVTRLRPKSGLSSGWLFQAVLPRIKFFEATISGTTVAHLGAKHLKTINLPLAAPAIQEQADRFFSPIDASLIDLKVANERLAASRDLLLPRLISGQLSVEAAERQLEDAA